MPVIAHNIASQFTSRQLNITTNKKTKSAEKLSSGYKINRSADDAAGLSISEKMRKQVRGLNQASRNIQDGVSLCQVADGALNETTGILQRMRELSIQSANGTNSESDRQAIQQEIDQLTKEVDRIAVTTSFNQDIFPLNSKVIPDDNSTIINSGNTIDSNPAVDKNYTVIDLSKLTSNLIITTDGKYSFVGDTEYSVYFRDCKVEAKFNGNTFRNGAETYFNNCNVNVEYDSVVFNDTTTPSGCPLNILFRNCNSTVTIKDTQLNDCGALFDGGKTDLVLDNSCLQGFENENGNSLDLILKNVNTLDGTYGAWVSFGSSNSSVTVSGDGSLYMNGGSNHGIGIDNTELNGGSIFATVCNNNYIVRLDDITINSGILEIHNTSTNSNVQTYGDININGGFLNVITNCNTLNNNPIYGGSNINMTGGHLKLESLNGTVLDSGIINFNIDGKSGPTATDTVYEVLLSDVTPNNKEESSSNNIPSMNNHKYLTSIKDIWIQSGANAGEGLVINLVDATAKGIGITDPNISVMSEEDCDDAMNRLDDAIQTVGSYRSQFGAYQNRLECAKAVDDNASENTQYAESRIRDTDMAEEMVEHSKNNILEQVGQSMLAQANQSTQGVLSLLG